MSDQLFGLAAWVAEPVGRPDSVELPVQGFEDLLPERVSVAGALGGMVGCAVALNSEQIAVVP